MKDKSKSINILNVLSALTFISALLVAIGMSFAYLGYYTPPVSMSYLWWTLIFTVLIVTSGVLASLDKKDGEHILS